LGFNLRSFPILKQYKVEPISPSASHFSYRYFCHVLRASSK